MKAIDYTVIALTAVLTLVAISIKQGKSPQYRMDTSMSESAAGFNPSGAEK